jgi:hypothetical protein
MEIIGWRAQASPLQTSLHWPFVVVDLELDFAGVIIILIFYLTRYRKRMAARETFYKIGSVKYQIRMCIVPRLYAISQCSSMESIDQMDDSP